MALVSNAHCLIDHWNHMFNLYSTALIIITCFLNILTFVIIKLTVKRPTCSPTGTSGPGSQHSYIYLWFFLGSSIIAKAVSFKSLNMFGSILGMSSGVAQVVMMSRRDSISDTGTYIVHLIVAVAVGLTNMSLSSLHIIHLAFIM